MSRVTCPNCGGDHPKWDCKRPATKSTAARKDVPSSQTGGAPVSTKRKEDCGGQQPQKQSLAGIQALPVDTKPRRGRPKMDAPTSARADYQREYVAKWRRGEVGNKHRSKAETNSTKES